jgi:hypothetical protein
MTPTELATALLTTGGRSLWAELEGRQTRPDERRPLYRDPLSVRDTRCERLLLGCLLTYGRYTIAGTRNAGLAPGDFANYELRALYERLIHLPHDQEWNLSLLADSRADCFRLTSLMTEYGDAASQVDATLPHTEHVDAREAAEALASRIVALSKAREHLRQADTLMQGRGVA